MQKTYNVVAERAPGGPYLLTEEDLATMDPATVEVVQYDPASKIAWKPWGLQMYLGRGYWYDPTTATVEADIQSWKDPANPSAPAEPADTTEEAPAPEQTPTEAIMSAVKKIGPKPRPGESEEEFATRYAAALRTHGFTLDNER